MGRSSAIAKPLREVEIERRTSRYYSPNKSGKRKTTRPRKKSAGLVKKELKWKKRID